MMDSFGPLCRSSYKNKFRPKKSFVTFYKSTIVSRTNEYFQLTKKYMRKKKAKVTRVKARNFEFQTNDTNI